MNQQKNQAFNLSCLFIIVFMLFQFKIYIVTYLFIFSLFFVLAFFQEKNRMFIWMIIAFFLAQFLLLYGDRVLESKEIPIYLLPTLKSCLLLLHVGFIFYIAKMFSFQTTPFFRWPTSFSTKHQLNIGGVIVVIFFFPFIFGFPLKSIFPIAIFAITYSVLSETLWRGILFTVFISTVGEKLAVVFTSLLFGFHYLAFGFSIITCVAFGLIGAFLASITIRCTSFVPAIFLHFTINIMIISISMTFRPIFIF